MALRIGNWGGRGKPDAGSEPGPEQEAADGRLACAQCGAVLAYAPGTTTLVCEYCGHANPIATRPVEIVENDLHDALQRGIAAAPVEEVQRVHCNSCAAEFTLDPNKHAGACPFCGQAAVTDTGSHRQIKPAALLPFVIERHDARERVSRWLKGLWFAPNDLKAFARRDDRLTGMYLPYWTFDSRTQTDYAGQRGTIYHVPVQVRTRVNGRMVTQTRMVQKVRWRPARGRVARVFDDVLVLASRSLPAWMTDRLEPWDLTGYQPYVREFLAGFESEAYQIPLDEGFQTAKQKMRAVIEGDVKADIGGDLQQIQRMQVEHRDPTFKHVLLPVWLGAFRFRGKSYRLCVNGRTGRVQGERPYSIFKIALAVLAVGALVALALYLAAINGQLQTF
jgi:DNA-directed RNA polymerase subunit RPC12/RpoP